MGNELPLVRKVRAIYYEPRNGLFLIQTEKSSRSEAWTTPGGQLKEGEDLRDGVRRLTLEDIGLEPNNIADLPFFEYRYVAKNTLFHSFAFEIELDLTKKGMAPSAIYRFAGDGKGRHIYLTKAVFQMVHSHQYREFIKNKRRQFTVGQ